MPNKKEMGELENHVYDNFIRGGLANRFTDDQVNFLWYWIKDRQLSSQ